MATFPLPTSIPVRSHHIPLCPTPGLAPRPAAIPGLLFRRPCQGTTCQPHHATAVPCLRFCNPHQIAACCMSHRTALHQPSHRTAFPRAGHSPLPVSPLSGHGFHPRVWPGSLCPPPECSIQETRGRGAQHGTPRPLEPRSPVCAQRETDAQSGMLYFPVGPQRSGATLYSYRRST